MIDEHVSGCPIWIRVFGSARSQSIDHLEHSNVDPLQFYVFVEELAESRIQRTVQMIAVACLAFVKSECSSVFVKT